MRIGRYRITRRGNLVFGLIGIFLMICIGLGIRNLLINQPQVDQAKGSSDHATSGSESSNNQGNQSQSENGAGNQTSNEGQTIGSDNSSNTSSGESSNELSKEEKNKIIADASTIIYFKPDAYDLDFNYYSHIDQIVNMANRFKDAKIIVEGHFNGVPNLKTNAFRTQLAENRAEVVEAYLVSQGIGSERIIIINKGASEPVNKDESWQEIEKNRRVFVYFKAFE